MSSSLNTLHSYDTLRVGEKTYGYYNLKAAENTLGSLSHLPRFFLILLENLLRHEDTLHVTIDDIRSLTALHALQKSQPKIVFHPSRLAMDDDEGVSALADIASLAGTLAANQSETTTPIASAYPLDIVITQEPALIDQNTERYKLLKWAEKNLTAIHLTPPQGNEETQRTLSSLTSTIRIMAGVAMEEDLVFPETILGTQRDIPVLGHKGVLGWPTGVLEIESLMLGQPMKLVVPPLIGVKITGKPHKGVGTTDIALTIMLLLHRGEAEGKVIEFFGSGLDYLSLSDRATIALMAEQQEGVLTTLFPIDAATITHRNQTGQDPDRTALIEAYARAQGLWREGGDDSAQDPTFNTFIELDLDSIRPVVRFCDSARTVLPLSEVAPFFDKTVSPPSGSYDPLAPIKHGDILLAALSSVSSPPHPTEMVIAALLAREAKEKGLVIKPWVRPLMAPLPPRLASFLRETGLQEALDTFGFRQNDAYAQSQSQAPLSLPILSAIKEKNLTTCTVGTEALLANASPLRQASAVNLIASPALVIAYALAGNLTSDLIAKPLGMGTDGKPVTLKDIWPSAAKINAYCETMPPHALTEPPPASPPLPLAAWQAIQPPEGNTFPWQDFSSTLKEPPTLQGFTKEPIKKTNIIDARIVALWGDGVQASWIGPDRMNSSTIAPTGHFEKMLVGAFQHPSLNNKMLPDNSPVGMTLHGPTGLTMTIGEAAKRYSLDKTPMVIIAGSDFGKGAGQEWAAKAIRFTGVTVVIAQSYNPAFCHNLIRMGILPLQLKTNMALADINLTGKETISLVGIPELTTPRSEVMMTVDRGSDIDRYMLNSRLNEPEDRALYEQGSLLALAARTLIPVAV
ncbi:MAG: aconitase family protein [Bdellovibrionales bacterium]|jgi:aconitate hydratase